MGSIRPRPFFLFSSTQRFAGQHPYFSDFACFLLFAPSSIFSCLLASAIAFVFEVKSRVCFFFFLQDFFPGFSTFRVETRVRLDPRIEASIPLSTSLLVLFVQASTALLSYIIFFSPPFQQGHALYNDRLPAFGP